LTFGTAVILVSDVAEAADGGRIDVQSCEVNGTTFRVTMPRS
jgi:hypothetical protein